MSVRRRSSWAEPFGSVTLDYDNIPAHSKHEGWRALQEYQFMLAVDNTWVDKLTMELTASFLDVHIVALEATAHGVIIQRILRMPRGC